MRPDVSSAKRPGKTEDAESDDDEDAEEEAEDTGPAPEDAARRYSTARLPCY